MLDNICSKDLGCKPVRNSTVSIKGPNGMANCSTFLADTDWFRDDVVITLPFRGRSVPGDREMRLRRNVPQDGPHGDCPGFQRSGNQGRHEHDGREARSLGKCFVARSIAVIMAL